MNELLAMWTVYDHPRDVPDCFVARKFLINDDGSYHPTDEMIRGPSLDTLRRVLVQFGLTPLTRSPEDDPVIVETWI